MTKAKELISWAQSLLGEHYLYGYKHQKITESLNKSLKSLYPDTWTTSYYNTAQSWLGELAVDCSGLISSKTGTERNSTSYYNTATKKVKYTKGMDLSDYKGWGIWKSGHIGIVEDSEHIIEARGINYGVVRNNASDRDFTYLLKLCDIDYTEETETEKAPYCETAEPDFIFNYLMCYLQNPYGVCGLMGNLYAESALIPINLQNSYESKLGYTDKTYTEAVDDGSYTKFSSDSAGYGLAQWTYSTRKKGLKNYCDAANASIGNLQAQLDYLIDELKNDYSSVYNVLLNAESVKEASDCVLTKFEKPADQSDSVKEKRAGYGQKYYEEYELINAMNPGWYYDGRWWYRHTYGTGENTYYHDIVVSIDGKCYAFDSDGYLIQSVNEIYIDPENLDLKVY